MVKRKLPPLWWREQHAKTLSAPGVVATKLFQQGKARSRTERYERKFMKKYDGAH